MPKSDRYYLPLRRSGDTPRMTEAVTWAEKAGLDPFFRPHIAQLKFGPVNFWPNTGKIHVDGQKRCTDHGLDAFTQRLASATSGSASLRSAKSTWRNYEPYAVASAFPSNATGGSVPINRSGAITETDK